MVGDVFHRADDTFGVVAVFVGPMGIAFSPVVTVRTVVVKLVFAEGRKLRSFGKIVGPVDAIEGQEIFGATGAAHEEVAARPGELQVVFADVCQTTVSAEVGLI